MQYKKLWIALSIVFIGSFTVLLFFGTKIYEEKPPIPSEVITDNGEVVYTETEIKEGQNIWERMGGQEIGTV